VRCVVGVMAVSFEWGAPSVARAPP
jgi:hypothetical protein